MELIEVEDAIAPVPSVVAEGVVKRYVDLVAVNQVSLSIGVGEIYGLLGPNGAGKSTLMRMVTGISQPDAGRVLIHGLDVTRNGTAAKQYLGYLPEELVLYERLSGREYLELVAGLRNTEPTRIAEEIEFFELDEVADKWVGGYSLGMSKKLGLAAAFLTLPTVLVLDEPLNGLDVEMMRKLRFRLIHHGQSGRSAIISSHVMSFVERVCGRVGILRDGNMIAEGTPDELRVLTQMDEDPFEDVFFALAIGPE